MCCFKCCHRCGCDCGFCWMILWLLILIFIAWPIALILALIYVILLPFKACCAGCVPVIDIVYEGVLLPLVCAENAVNGTPMC